jgi:hypothetical protein
MFDRSLWQESFGKWPTWPCPACNSVALTLSDKKSALLCEETGPSSREHDHEAWEPDWINKRFVALLKCHNPTCGELVGIGGHATVHEWQYYDDDGHGQSDYSDQYTPIFFDRAPPIFPIPEQCPAAVKAHLAAAFALIWFDVGSAANRMRAGVEALLDDQRIQKSKSGSKKRQYLTTHVRIEKLEVKNPDAAQYLMAIKWLGNTGSHGATSNLSRDDLLNAAEFFEAAVDLLYVKRATKIRRLASEINRRKGPKKRSKRRNDGDATF